MIPTGALRSSIRVIEFFGGFKSDGTHFTKSKTLLSKEISTLRRGDLTIHCVARDKAGLCDLSNARAIHAGRPFVLDQSHASSADTVNTPSDDLRQLDGIFSCVLIGDREIILATDTMGAGRLFYAVIGNDLYFGSALGAVLDALPSRPRVNNSTVTEVLCCRFQLSDETIFSGVYRLPAGHYLDVSRNEDDTLSTRLVQYMNPGELLGGSDSLSPERLSTLLSQSLVRESHDDDTCLMLSGGYDSRAIALHMQESCRAVTYGISGSTDVLGAQRFARKAGFEHHLVPYESWTVGDYKDLITTLHAGHCGLQAAHHVVGFDYASQYWATAIIGFLGDMLTGAHLPASPPLTDECVYGYLISNAKHPLLTDQLAAEIAALKDRVSTTVHSRNGAPDLESYMLADLCYRQARLVADIFTTCGWYIDISTPFFHRQLLTSALATCGGQLFGQTIYRELLSDLCRARGIPLDEGYIAYWYSRIKRGVSQRLGNRVPEQVRYSDVYLRSQMHPRDYLTGNASLDQVLTQSFQYPDVDYFHDPIFLTAAGLGSAIRRYS